MTEPNMKAGSSPKNTDPAPFPAQADRVDTCCRHCGLWETLPSDAYCGFCGHLLLPLIVAPDPLVLISGIVRERDLVLSNAGPLPLPVVLAPTTLPFPGLSFEPAGPVEIPAGSEIRIKARLDESRLPADLIERSLRYVCVVDDDPRKVQEVHFEIRSGPKPRLLTQALDFGDVPDGSRTERHLEIANAGGTPLIVQNILPEGSSQLVVGTSARFPTRLEPGVALSLPVFWDASLDERDGSQGTAGLRISFANYAESLFVPARARLFRYHLHLDRPSIHIPDALSGHEYVATVTLENRGSSDVEISSIESDQPWIVLSGRTRNFTLRCRESLKMPADGSAIGSIRFLVICRPKDLAAGRHKGQVKIWPAGLDPKILEVEIDVVRSVEYREYIGIDFGTTNSVVAVVDQESQSVELVQQRSPEGALSPLIPSVLAFVDGTDHYKIGYEARNEPADRIVRSIKRIMGYDHEREFFGRKFSPELLASLIIKRLVQLAESHLYQKTKTYYAVRKAIITVPANFFDLQIRGVLEACELAGLDTEEVQVRQAAGALRTALGQEVNAGVILDEPSAATLYYLSLLEESGGTSDLVQIIDQEGGLNLLVYDHGGGTLDISIANVVRMEQGAVGLKVLATVGNNRIGGDSIDVLLMREIVARCQREVKGFSASLIMDNFERIQERGKTERWSDDISSRVLGARSQWKDLAEKAKIELSSAEECLVQVPPQFILRLEKGQIRGAESEFITVLRRNEMEELIEGTLVECAGLVEAALRLAQLTPQQVHFILHTGRQSFMPAIRTRVKSLFPDLPEGRALFETERLKVCVAQGAALCGLMRGKLLDPRSGIHFLTEGRRLPHSYGVEKIVGIMRREFDEIIARGEAYPISAERHYDATRVPESGWLNLKFYQNLGNRKSIARNRDIRLIGQITAEARIDGKPGCHVRFFIDANRKLEVYVNDKEVDIEPARIPDEESWMG